MKQILDLFKNGSVSVCGYKGSGKDILFSNVVARRNLDYISNIDYKCNSKFIQFNINEFNVNNNYDNFLKYNLNYYYFPYPDNTDIYLSDCGIYFPSQFQGDLVKKYQYFSVFIALSRQLGECRVHTNAQYLGRVWDKIREQSDTYILCNKCIVLFGKIVIQDVYIYDKYESALNKVPPFKIDGLTFLKKDTKKFIELEKIKYKINYGSIKHRLLIYIHKSKYDTRFFKGALKNGKQQEKK